MVDEAENVDTCVGSIVENESDNVDSGRESVVKKEADIVGDIVGRIVETMSINANVESDTIVICVGRKVEK